jgi:hypothetical protein
MRSNLPDYRVQKIMRRWLGVPTPSSVIDVYSGPGDLTDIDETPIWSADTSPAQSGCCISKSVSFLVRASAEQPSECKDDAKTCCGGCSPTF